MRSLVCIILLMIVDGLLDKAKANFFFFANFTRIKRIEQGNGCFEYETEQKENSTHRR